MGEGWPDAVRFLVTVAGVALIVWGTRSVFLWAPRAMQPGPVLERALRHAPLASLVALVAPEACGALLADPLTWSAVWRDARLPATVATLAVGAWRRHPLAGLTAGAVVYGGLLVLA